MLRVIRPKWGRPREKMRVAASPQSSPFWGQKGRVRRRMRWQHRLPVTLICLMKGPTFCERRLSSPSRGGHNREKYMNLPATTQPTKTPLLDRVREPHDLRQFSRAQLKQLADELRQETIAAVSVTGGHLGAGLGVVELTVALHHVFDTPRDRLVWDVGHQAYPHKILTGRRDRIRTLRQGGGLSGFTKRTESVYYCFGGAHSSTSISAGLGFAVAR